MSEPVSLSNYPDLTQKVYEIIRDRIMTLQLAPGSPIVVVELALSLGVSRTPVKAALGRLAAEGLVEDVPRKGCSVARLDIDDMADLISARLMLELAAAERAIDLVEAVHLEELWELVEKMERAITKEGSRLDFVAFAAVDSQFHELFVSTARNRHLAEMHHKLCLHVHLARMHFAAQVDEARTLETVPEHKAILVALGARDLPALRLAITNHLQNTERAFVPGPAG